MTFVCRNTVLSQIEPAILMRAGNRIEKIEVRRGSVLQESGATVQWVYFPEDALICLDSENVQGESVSGGMIGWNGVYGAFEACGSRKSFSRGLVQITGSCFKVRADHYRELFDQSAGLRLAIHRHIEAVLVESRQLVACAALHTVESRMCRVLLDASDRSHGGSLLSLTQETLAQILGVQRTTVAVTASSLQKSRMIRTGRGNVQLLDRAKLEDTACSCRQAIADATDQIYASSEKACEA
jgi:CRP-like cAMP-binding protein